MTRDQLLARDDEICRLLAGECSEEQEAALLEEKAIIETAFMARQANEEANRG